MRPRSKRRAGIERPPARGSRRLARRRRSVTNAGLRAAKWSRSTHAHHVLPNGRFMPSALTINEGDSVHFVGPSGIAGIIPLRTTDAIVRVNQADIDAAALSGTACMTSTRPGARRTTCCPATTTSSPGLCGAARPAFMRSVQSARLLPEAPDLARRRPDRSRRRRPGRPRSPHALRRLQQWRRLPEQMGRARRIRGADPRLPDAERSHRPRCSLVRAVERDVELERRVRRGLREGSVDRRAASARRQRSPQHDQRGLRQCHRAAEEPRAVDERAAQAPSDHRRFRGPRRTTGT